MSSWYLNVGHDCSFSVYIQYTHTRGYSFLASPQLSLPKA